MNSKEYMKLDKKQKDKLHLLRNNNHVINGNNNYRKGNMQLLKISIQAVAAAINNATTDYDENESEFKNINRDKSA